MGDAVNVAARLQSRCAAGLGTRRRGRRSRSWRTGSRGTTAARSSSRARPIRSSPSRSRATAPAARGRSDPGSSARMVGRERELARARGAVDAVAEGTGGIVFVTGEPGIGKTRMVHELRRAFGATTPRYGRSLWLEGRCVSYGGSIPYWPFRDLLRSWLGVGERRTRAPRAGRPAPPDRPPLRRARRRDGARTSRRCSGSRPPPARPIAARRALARGAAVPHVRGRAPRRSQDWRPTGPVAVALEDLHWADATSLQLLEGAGRATPRTRRCCSSARPARARSSRAWRLKEDVARTLPHRFREVSLEALSGDAGRELLTALVGEDTLPAGRASGSILEPAEGNPFFLEELVRSMVDAGALVRRRDEGWRFDHDVDLQVPPTVEKVILARIDRLEPPAHDAVVCRLGPRAVVQPAAAAGGGGRRRRAGGARRADAGRPRARGSSLAGARVPVHARADPGDRVPDPGRRGPRTPAPQGRDVARAAPRRP